MRLTTKLGHCMTLEHSFEMAAANRAIRRIVPRFMAGQRWFHITPDEFFAARRAVAEARERRCA